MIGPRVGAKVGPRVGPAAGIGEDEIGAGGLSSVSRDTLSGIYCPANAFEWSALMAVAGLATGNPGSVWLCQEASGSLADSIGSVTLSQLGAGHLYQQAVTGWTRKAATCTDGTANQRWGNSVSAPDAFTTSCLWLAYVRMPTAAPAANRDILGCTNSLELRVTTTPRMQLIDATTTDGTNNPLNAVRPLALRFNRTATTVGMFTDQEKVAGSYNSPGSSSPITHLGGQALNAPDAGFLYVVEFSGAAAELSDAQMKTLLQTLGWTIPWS